VTPMRVVGVVVVRMIVVIRVGWEAAEELRLVVVIWVWRLRLWGVLVN
jgi:hypothetical protein